MANASALAPAALRAKSWRPRRSPAALAAVALAHGGLAWVLAQAPWRAAMVVLSPPPLLVRLVGAPAVPAAEAPLPLPQRAPPRPEVPRLAPPEITLAAPTLAFAAPPQPHAIATTPDVAAPAPALPASASAPAVTALTSPTPAADEPRSIASSAVQYLVAPAPVYPPLSRRLRETGTVLLRVLVDADGLPRRVVVERSSGFARLDEAAAQALRAARFKPYAENGRAIAVWAPAPVAFVL